MIDLILKRHIRVIKFSNNLASKINLEFLGFRNELVTDLLIDKEVSIFLDSVSRIDKFLEKMHVKFHQLKRRIHIILEETLVSLFSNEVHFLESNFTGMYYNSSKIPKYELFGVYYRDHIHGIFHSLKNEIVSNYKISISHNYPDSYLLEKFRGTNNFNYKDNIFKNYQTKLKTFVKNFIISFSSHTRFFFYHNNKDKFPFFTEALPFSESKPNKTKLGVYVTSDFSAKNNSDVWSGCLPHFNSTVTQVPLFELENYKNFDYRNWFFSKKVSFQKEVLGEKRFNLMKSDKDLPYSQIFDFSKSTVTLENL